MTATNRPHSTATTIGHPTRTGPRSSASCSRWSIDPPGRGRQWSGDAQLTATEQLPAPDPADRRRQRHRDLAARAERLCATDRRRRHDLGAHPDPRDRHLVHGLGLVLGRQRRSCLRQEDQERRRQHVAPALLQAQHERRSVVRVGPRDDVDRLEHRRPGDRPALERPGQHRLDRPDERQHLHADQHRSGVTFSAARYVGHSKNSEVGRVVTYRRRPPARDRDRRDVPRLYLGPRHAGRPPHAQQGRQLDVGQGAQHVRRLRVQPRGVGEQGRHRLHAALRAR